MHGYAVIHLVDDSSKLVGMVSSFCWNKDNIHTFEHPTAVDSRSGAFDNFPRDVNIGGRAIPLAALLVRFPGEGHKLGFGIGSAHSFQPGFYVNIPDDVE